MKPAEGRVLLVVATSDLRPGMSLAAAVPQPGTPGQDLLKRGVVLDPESILRLREIGVPALYVDFAPLAELDRQIEVLASPARLAMLEMVRGVYERAAKPGPAEFPFAAIYHTSRELIAAIMAQGLRPIMFDPGARDPGDLAAHAAAVTQLSLTLGVRLERYLIRQRSRLPPHHAREVVNLGVAAMLHDIGLLRLDSTLHGVTPLRPPESPEACETWQSHTRLGYELVKGGVEASAASAVLHHHQAFDGSGFPRLTLGGKRVRWARKRLHVFARILAAANLFDRYLLAEGHSPLARLRALRQLREKHARSLDGIVVKAIHQACPPFPPGSVVTLDDGSKAVVVLVDDEQVYRPVVRRMADLEPGQVMPELTGDAVDLRIDPSRRIVELMGQPTEGLLCTSGVLDAIARSAEDPADREKITALRGEDAERAYARPARPHSLRAHSAAAPHASSAPPPPSPGPTPSASRPPPPSPEPTRGGRLEPRGFDEDIPEPDLDTLPTPPATPPEAKQQPHHPTPKAA